MTLLEALVKATEKTEVHVKNKAGELARTVFFVFTEDGESAFLSEVAMDELVPLLEKWCAEQRVEMGTIQ